MSSAQHSDVSSAAIDSIDAAEAKARETIEKSRDKAVDAVEALDELENRAAEQLERSTDQLASYIREKPLQAAGIAFAAGVLTTLLLRRS